MAESRRKSCVWNFFKISASDESKAVCDTCGDNISRGGKCSKTFTTSNLKKHMKLRHSPQFKEQEKSREAEAMESCQENRSRGSQQVSLEFIVEKKKQFAFDHPKQKLEIVQYVAILDWYLEFDKNQFFFN